MSKSLFYKRITTPTYYNKVRCVILDWSGVTVDKYVLSSPLAYKELFDKYNIDITINTLRKKSNIQDIFKDADVRNQWLQKMGKNT